MFDIKEPGLQRAPFKASIYGPPGSGKTLTSLMFGERLAERRKGKCLLVDTESSAKNYGVANPSRDIHPEALKFRVVQTRSLTDVLDGIRTLPPEYTCIIVDSISHLWDAAFDAWKSKNPGREPQLKDWGTLKRPYKDLMKWVVQTDRDVILCGRQKNVFGKDDAGDLQNLGVGMRAEGETQYEPDVVFRMYNEGERGGESIVTAYCEKDRWSIYSGKRITKPTGETLVPYFAFIGEDPGKVEDDDERAERDSELVVEAAEKEAAKREKSAGILTDYSGRIVAASDMTALGSIAADLKKLRRYLVEEHYQALATQYQTRAQALTPKV